MATTKNGIYYPNDGTQPADVLGDMKKMAESIDEAINDNTYDDTEIKEDITEIKEKQETQNKSIEKNATNIQSLQEENANLKAQIPTGTASGEEISLSDSAKMELVDFGLQGNSEQETREGYNLIDKSNVSLFNENKYIQGIVDLKSNTNYTIYFNKIPTDVSWKFEDESTVNYTSVNSNIKTFESGTHTSLSFYFGQDEIFSSVEEFLNTVQLMVLEGLYTADTIPKYEEYGAMPSLNYPSEVEAVGDNINLFDTELEQGGLLTDGGQNFDSEQRIRTKDFIDLQSGTYTLSFKGLTYSAGLQYETDGTYIKTLWQFTEGTYTFTISEKSKIRITFRKENPDENVNVSDIYDIKLEKGTVATPYSQYGQGNIEIIHQNKNMLSNLPATQTINGVTFTNNEDGTYTVNGTATSVCLKKLTWGA